jgi:uncharacterized protein
MDLSLEPTEGFLLIRRVGSHSITLLDREVAGSFLLTPDGTVASWAVDVARALDDSHVDEVLALKPELVILGTGERQVFPAAAFMAGFLRRGIGIEVMDNAAAARTYNLLASEGRRVVAGFLLPEADR